MVVKLVYILHKVLLIMVILLLEIIEINIDYLHKDEDQYIKYKIYIYIK